MQHLLHYLDDFLTAGPANTEICQQNLTNMLSLCHKINVPVKGEKVEGPTTRLTFLGIVLDTVAMTASISGDRKCSLLASLQEFISRPKCTKRELLSLVGTLSFACKVVPAGRIFLRRLIDLSCTVQRMHHHIRITNEARLDMQWWLDFLPSWPGTSLILDTDWSSSTAMHLFTDASSTVGWGAYWSGRWLQAHWSPTQSSRSIVWKELYAIVMATNTWGRHWNRKKILFHCDNHAVVDIWHKGSTPSAELMTLVRSLYFCAAHHNINVMVAHIAGTSNIIADALSRFQMHRFRILAPQANLLPDTILALPIHTSPN